MTKLVYVRTNGALLEKAELDETTGEVRYYLWSSEKSAWMRDFLKHESAARSRADARQACRG